MVANCSPRQVASVYRRLCPADGVEGTGPSRGPGRPRTRMLSTLMGTRTAQGRPRRGRPPTPAHDQSEDHPEDHEVAEDHPEDHEVATDNPSVNNGAMETDEGTQQTEDSSAHSTPYLRGATRLPSVPHHERRPLIRPAGRR